MNDTEDKEVGVGNFDDMFRRLTNPEEREKRAYLAARAKRIAERKADTGAYVA